MRRELKYFSLWLALGWLIVGAVIFLSLVSSLPIDIDVRHSDKLGHVIAYTVLMGWFVQLFHNRTVLIIHALLLIAMGIGLEFAQEYHSRHFEYADMVANSLGVVFGFVLLFTPLHRVLQWFERRFLIRN